MKIRAIILMTLLLITSACDKKKDIAAIKQSLTIEKVWIFAQFNVERKKNGIQTYYYYGKVSKDTYRLISQNKLTHGFILLEDVKYWDDNDLIAEYKDTENAGQLIFRIEDIRKIDLVNLEPKAGLGSEQFEAESKVAGAGAAAMASKIKTSENKIDNEKSTEQ